MKNESTGDIKKKAAVWGISVLLGFVVSFLIMLLFAVLATGADISEEYASPMACISAAAGGLAAAFCASRLLGSKGMINGLVCGSTMFIIIKAVALAMDDGGLTLNTLFHFVVLLLAAMIGGIWGVNSGRKKII